MTETTLRRIDEPDMTPTDDEAIRHLLRRCFPGDDSAFAVTRHWHGSAPAYSFVALRQSVPCGHVGCVVRTIRVGTEDVRVAGIQNLATAPDCAAPDWGLD